MNKLIWLAALHRADQLTGLSMFLMFVIMEKEPESVDLAAVLSTILARHQAFEEFCADQALDPAVGANSWTRLYLCNRQHRFKSEPGTHDTMSAPMRYDDANIYTIR